MLKIFYLLLMKSSILVGGQAVIEGVMMRVPGAYATAVRDSNGKIHVDSHQFQSRVEKYKLNKFIIVRGFIHLVDSMKIGFKTLDWSSTFVEDNEKKNKNNLVNLIMTIFAILVPISLFMLIPYYLTELFIKNQFFGNNNFSFNLVAGITRIFIFIFYLIIISQLKDIKRINTYNILHHHHLFY